MDHVSVIFVIKARHDPRGMKFNRDFFYPRELWKDPRSWLGESKREIHDILVDIGVARKTTSKIIIDPNVKIKKERYTDYNVYGWESEFNHVSGKFDVVSTKTKDVIASGTFATLVDAFKRDPTRKPSFRMKDIHVEMDNRSLCTLRDAFVKKTKDPIVKKGDVRMPLTNDYEGMMRKLLKDELKDDIQGSDIDVVRVGKCKDNVEEILYLSSDKEGYARNVTCDGIINVMTKTKTVGSGIFRADFNSQDSDYKHGLENDPVEGRITFSIDYNTC